MKNKKHEDEQSISLFDGHEDLIKEIEVADAEGEEVTEEVAEEPEESTTQFVIESVEEGEDPYYDEDDVVMPDEEEYAPEEEILADGEEADDGSEEEAEVSEEIEEAEAVEEKKPLEAQKTEKPRRIDSLFDFVEQFIFALAAVFIVTSFFFKYSNVVGDSMQNTLQSGEKLVLSALFYDPEPGDIVVIDDRSLKDPIVKRVIAVGGQTVKFTRDAVYVDGVMLTESYVYIDTANGKYQYSVVPCAALLDNLVGYEEGVYYEILVPDNEVFVMGDHRNDSYDSRDIGTLHEDAVLGKAILRFFPFDKFGKID